MHRRRVEGKVKHNMSEAFIVFFILANAWIAISCGKKTAEKHK